MTSDVILIPTSYTVCQDGVEFDLSVILELRGLIRTVETALGVRLEPVGLIDGYVRYRRTHTRRHGESADLPNEPVGHPTPADPSGIDPVHCELISTGDSECNSGREEDHQHSPETEVEAPARRVTAGDGRPVLLGDRPLVVPVSTPAAPVAREAEAVWTDLVATGETCFECSVSTSERFMFRAGQMPANASVGDEIELHGVHSESIALVDASVSPQLDLDLGGVSEEPDVS